MTDLTEQLQSVIDNFKKELGSFHIGRATPALVEDLMVDYYGTMTPMKQLATITTPEAKVLLIQPFDQNASKSIEAAISASDIGVQPVNEGKQLRIVLPPVTDERRQQLVKTVHEKIEESRIRVRRVREDAMKDLKAREKDGSISEDERAREEKVIQEEIDGAIATIDEMGETKEDEISHV